MIAASARLARIGVLALLGCGGRGAADASPGAASATATPAATPATSPEAGPSLAAAPAAPRDAAGTRAAEPAHRLPLLHPVNPEHVCATLGTPRPSPGGFVVEDPKLRATFAGSRGQVVELAFRYLGESAVTSKLRSGLDRSQLGLELLAENTCNLLYVMWRIEPSSELVVSLKRNPGQATHAECENRGYERLRPVFSAPVPALVPGARHRLRADLASGGELTVRVDGEPVWRGPVGSRALELAGASGLRSDNARYEVIELRADRDGERRGACRARISGEKY